MGGTVACLGPAGSFSERAAGELCRGARILLTGGCSETFEKLISGEADFAVIPVENSIQGGVLQNLDYLARTQGVLATRECVLSIDHRLVTKGKIDARRVERIYSHEQALAQCSLFLDQFFPRARRVCTASTAECLTLLDDRSAGIVGAHVKGEGLFFSTENIANERDNFTRFLRFERRSDPPEEGSKIFFCAALADGAGELFRFLGIFARKNVNLTRIESRPIPERVGCYRFFIECAGNIGETEVSSALEEAKIACAEFKLLGAY